MKSAPNSIGDHPARAARIRLENILSCEEHQMEDGDHCKHCGARSWEVVATDEERRRILEGKR